MATTLTRSGIVRDTRFTLPLGALDAAGVVEYLSYLGPATIEQLKAQPHFPEAIKPTGAKGQSRWIVKELDEWLENQCLRANAAAGPRRWAATDPRRIRANQRAAARAAKKSGGEVPRPEAMH
jgi:hypothetical protein